ncbi:hypothetical protein CAPTEDRAFT_209385 [Capitella teleta]|uniref:C-type lectin domain-containing protein n=1 Tax=Capitella teleta TaxID=283909 RepID=R7UWY0_CAPTE|nr:hypothetical protein CAPTEDRAFT_209385 [Capitella teleta]|eukprot:ELU11098.1 hypothetical protein CAPTEDRAFT_209385 [Capitella teleta]
MMKDEGINDIWLGLTDEPSDVWMWSASQEEIMPQGCFTDRSGNRDLPYSAGLRPDEVSIEKCVEKCRELSWEYAGTQVGSECWCGRDFGNSGNTLTTDCRVTCRGNALQYCGGSKKNYIYRTDGAYGVWRQSQPNNHDGYQWCAAMDSSADYKFADEPCDRQVHFVCDMPPSTVCNREVNQGRLVEVDDECYFLSYDMKDWFAAQKECWNKGGQLVELSNAKQHEKLGNAISSYSQKLTEYYWIGLQKRYLNWPDGSSMTYSNFKASSPTKYTGTCFKMVKSDEYKWVNVECSERHEFICQYGSIPTTTPSTTTKSTPTTSSSSISSTKYSTLSTTLTGRSSTPTSSPSSTAGIITPSAAAKSTDDKGGFDYNGLFISLIVLVSILIIIVIAAMLYMLWLRKKNKRQAIHPETSYNVQDFENKNLSTPKTIADSNPYSSIHPKSTGMNSQQGHALNLHSDFGLY